MIKGVGAQYAKKIVRQFGVDTLDIIKNQPDRLLEVESLGAKRVSMIKQSWQEQVIRQIQQTTGIEYDDVQLPAPRGDGELLAYSI